LLATLVRREINMPEPTERTDFDLDATRPSAAASPPVRWSGVRITTEQLAAAERARDYHARRFLETAAAGAPAAAEPMIRSEH
jgi:hypothetical protein